MPGDREPPKGSLSGNNDGQWRNPWAVAIGIVVSLLFLGGALSLLYERPSVLKLPWQWLALAIVPAVFGLVVGGYISKVSFGGLAIERGGYISGLPRFEHEQPEEKKTAINKALNRLRSSSAEERPSWAKPPKGLNGKGEYLALVHSYKPSEHTGQKYDVSIYIMKHVPGQGKANQTVGLEGVEKAEFFFGPSWGNRVFSVLNNGGVIGVDISAWGMFLATCRVTFNDGSEPLVLYRYIDFEEGRVVS